MANDALQLLATYCDKYDKNIDETTTSRAGSHTVRLSIAFQVTTSGSAETLSEARRKAYRELFDHIEYLQWCEVLKERKLKRPDTLPPFEARFEILEKLQNMPAYSYRYIQYSDKTQLEDFREAAKKLDIQVLEDYDSDQEDGIIVKVIKAGEGCLVKAPRTEPFSRRWDVLRNMKNVPAGMCIPMQYDEATLYDDFREKAAAVGVHTAYDCGAIILTKKPKAEELVEDFFVRWAVECNILP